LELKPGQTGNLNLNVNPGADVEADTYDVMINLEVNNVAYSKNVDVKLKKESELGKKAKATLKFYQYYIYLGIVIIVVILIFIRPIRKLKNRIKGKYEKYSIRRQRLIALKLAREKKEAERKEELEDNKEERLRKKELRIVKVRKSTKFWTKPWVYVLALIIIIAGILLGHYFRLFNAKYLNVYISNFFIGNLYYLLIGSGIVVILFLLLLAYNYLTKGGKKVEIKAKKEIKLYNTTYFRIIILILIGVLIYAVSYQEIRDFLILYSSYVSSGVVILVVIILLIRYYKPLVKFLRE